MVQTLQKTVEVPQMQLFCGCGRGMYSADFAGDTSPCAVLVSLVRRPMMLGIMAGLTQVNWASRSAWRNWVYWEMTSYVSVFGSLVRQWTQFYDSLRRPGFPHPLVSGKSVVRCSVFAFEVQDYGFFWEVTSGMVSVFSAFWVASGYLFCVSSRRLHRDFSYFLCEGGTLDPLGDSRFFLHTWPMRKWLRLLSFRQWHGFCWFADEFAPRAVFPSSSAAVHQVRQHIPVMVQRLIPMVLVIMGIPQLLFIDTVIDDPVVLVVRVPRVPSWMRQSCSHGCTR